MAAKKLALLIDGDNAQFQYLKEIIQFCEVFGTLAIKRAYGDWDRKLSAHRKTLKACNVEYIEPDTGEKNAADFEMSMDAAVILDNHKVDIYFVVANDGHFTTLFTRILKTGAKVIVIGNENNISLKLQKAATLFFEVEEIVKNQSKALVKSKPKKLEATLKKQSNTSQKVVPPKSKLRPKLKMLVRAYQDTTQNDGWVHNTQLREVLRQMDKHYDERFGKKKILIWIRELFADKFDIDGHYIRMK